MSQGVNVPFDLRDMYFWNKSTATWPPSMDFSLVYKAESCQSAVLIDSDNAFPELIRETRKTKDKYKVYLAIPICTPSSERAAKGKIDRKEEQQILMNSEEALEPITPDETTCWQLLWRKGARLASERRYSGPTHSGAF